MTNCNPQTHIRYGTIYLNSLDPDTADALFYSGTNTSEIEIFAEIELEVNIEAEERGFCESDKERWIERELEKRSENVQIDEPTIEGEMDGVKYQIGYLGGAALLWVFESPHLAKARLCSPCVPNAGNLESLDPDGYECYDVPAAWRTTTPPYQNLKGIQQ